VIFAAWANATTYYVSQSTDNGYAVGNNSNNGTSPSTPYLTFAKILTVYNAGDIVYINNGTYAATTFYNIQKGFTVLPVVDYAVTLTGNTTAQIVALYIPTGQTMTFGRLIMDACTYPSNAVIVCRSSGTITVKPKIIFNQTKFTGSVQSAISGTNSDYDLEANGIICDTSISTSIKNPQGYAIAISANLTGNIVLNSPVINIVTNQGYATSGGIFIDPGATNTSSVSIVSPIINITNTKASAIQVNGIYVYHINDASITGGTITINCGINQSISGIAVLTKTGTLSANNAVIANNNITITNMASGFGICIGVDDDNGGTANIANNGRIYGNTIQRINGVVDNTPHGIALNSNTGGRIYKNTIIGFGPAILASKTDSTTLIYNNITKNGLGNYQLFAKGATGTIFANNTCSTISDIGTIISVQDQGAVHNNNPFFINNIGYNSVATGAKLVVVNANNTASFNNNLYFVSGAVSNPFSYQGTNYATFALWQAAGKDVYSLYADPIFISTSDFHLQPTSPCIGAGTFAIGIHDQPGASDYDGVPFNSMFPYIGAYDYIAGGARPTLRGLE
jgi:hypothetical protein